MVQHLLGEEHPALCARLARESEGVPLYMVETLKAWRDEGYLRPTEQGTWEWAGDGPDTLVVRSGEAIIAHRLSRLTSTARELLNVAAVIGTEMDFDLLASVCALPPPDLDLSDPDLYLVASDELLRMGLLVETEAGYRFSHDQVRQIVYHRMPLSKRQRFHHRIAQAMEVIFPDRYESLAHHFAAAGERRPTIHYLLWRRCCAWRDPWTTTVGWPRLSTCGANGTVSRDGTNRRTRMHAQRWRSIDGWGIGTVRPPYSANSAGTPSTR
jgi:predicted ATPase